MRRNRSDGGDSGVGGDRSDGGDRGGGGGKGDEGVGFSPRLGSGVSGNTWVTLLSVSAS